jgi:NitT/TauT family transport system substrate-binding protein
MPDRPCPSARPLRCALALAATLLAVAGCGGSDSGDSGGGGGGGGPTPSRPAKVDVGTLPISNAAPMYLGMRKGFFEEEGLELVPHVAQNGAELITGALSGSFDFIFAGYIPSIVARAKGLPITVVAASDLGAKEDSKEWTVTLSKRGSDIRTPKDLEGRTIAVNGLRGVGEVVIKASLEKQGVDPNSIKLLEVPFPEMPVALERGRVDAIWAAEPFLTQELGEGAREVDAPLVTLAPNFVNGGYEANDKYIAQNGDLVERFNRAMSRSVDYAHAHPDEVRRTIPTFTKIPPAVAQRIRLPVWSSKLDRRLLQQAADYTQRYGIIDKAPAVDEMVWKGVGAPAAGS